MRAHEVAMICHEANRALQRVQDAGISSPPWEAETPETWRSRIQGVLRILDDETPEQSHQGWTYGPIKQHPCMVDYKDLPESQQLKDHLFASIIKTIALYEGIMP